MFESAPYRQRFEFIAGWLCLDFTNTINLAGARPNERLKGYVEWVAWGCLAGLIGEGQGRALVEEATRQPDRATEALADARALRLVLHRIFSARAFGDTPDAEDIGALNKALAYAAPYRQLRPAGADFEWGWEADSADLGQMLRPVIWSAGTLLTAAQLANVKRCQGSGCAWLFLDQSRNHGRRWCNMGECGNRAKANRYYRRLAKPPG